MLGVDWQACNASQEWDQPVVMEDKRRQVFLSDAVLSNSGRSYSNQVFSFTLSRKKEHCECECVVGHFILASTPFPSPGVDYLAQSRTLHSYGL